MKNDYWQKRAKRREAEAKAKGESLKKELFEEYKKAIKDIGEKISVFYTKYSLKNKITAGQAMKKLSESDFRQWKKSLEEYSNEIEKEVDKVKKAELKARLDALSYNSQISRLEALKEEIGASLSTLSIKSQNIMTNGFSDIFVNSMVKKTYDLSKKGINPNIKIREKIFDENLVKEVLNYPWSGADYSERLWKNTNNLSNIIKQELTQGMIKGTALPQISKVIGEKTGQSFKVCERLIETETSRIHEEAQFKVYEAAGIEEYEFISENELTTCSTCGELDGQHFKLKDRVVGINCNPMHPHCHCTTIEYDPEERLDYGRSGLEYKPRQTYKEWLEEQKTIYSEEKIKNEFKKLKNKSADEKQYEKYKEALGKENVPKRLVEFQELKYNKGEGWEQLKDKYRDTFKSKKDLEKEIPQINIRDKNSLKIYTNDEIKEMAVQTAKIADKYTTNESKWSGNIIFDSPESGYGKLWNCDIACLNETAPHIILHEHLHAHSVSYYDIETFDVFDNIEEATVQFLNQEICKNEGIEIIESGYDEMVDSLRNINKILNKGNVTNLDFAKKLFEVDLPKRYEWLDKNIEIFMQNNGSIKEYKQIKEHIKFIKEWYYE